MVRPSGRASEVTVSIGRRGCQQTIHLIRPFTFERIWKRGQRQWNGDEQRNVVFISKLRRGGPGVGVFPSPWNPNGNSPDRAGNKSARETQELGITDNFWLAERGGLESGQIRNLLQSLYLRLKDGNPNDLARLVDVLTLHGFLPSLDAR